MLVLRGVGGRVDEEAGAEARNLLVVGLRGRKLLAAADVRGTCVRQTPELVLMLLLGLIVDGWVGGGKAVNSLRGGTRDCDRCRNQRRPTKSRGTLRVARTVPSSPFVAFPCTTASITRRRDAAIKPHGWSYELCERAVKFCCPLATQTWGATSQRRVSCRRSRSRKRRRIKGHHTPPPAAGLIVCTVVFFTSSSAHGHVGQRRRERERDSVTHIQ